MFNRYIIIGVGCVGCRCSLKTRACARGKYFETQHLLEHLGQLFWEDYLQSAHKNCQDMSHQCKTCSTVINIYLLYQIANLLQETFHPLETCPQNLWFLLTHVHSIYIQLIDILGL